jgi:hypothetical protein
MRNTTRNRNNRMRKQKIAKRLRQQAKALRKQQRMASAAKPPAA